MKNIITVTNIIDTNAKYITTNAYTTTPKQNIQAEINEQINPAQDYTTY